MEYNFSKLSQEQAEKISNWHYDGEYSFYDFENDEEALAELLSPHGDNYYMVKKDKEEVGFFCFETENDSVEIGLGMKPELTGRGMGLDFFKAGLNFAISKYNPQGCYSPGLLTGILVIIPIDSLIIKTGINTNTITVIPFFTGMIAIAVVLLLSIPISFKVGKQIINF